MIDFSLTDEQQRIVALAAEFGREVWGPAEVALDRMADPADVFASAIWKDAMAQAFALGFHKMSLPDYVGGLGLDPQTIGLVWEELARHGVGLTASLVAGSVVPALIMFLAGHDRDLVGRYVEPFCADETGTWLTGWGSSEPMLGSDGKNYEDRSIHHRTLAVPAADGYRLSGAKSAFVSNGGVARVLAVFACVDPAQGLRGSGMFIVDGEAPGLSRGIAENRLGLRALNQAAIALDDVHVSAGHLIFPPGDAYPMLHRAIMTVGNLATGYLAVGVMRAAYEDALAYARERVQWGRPIIEHQLVARRLFQTRTAIESARGLLWRGSWHATRGFPGDLVTSVSGKILATSLAVRHTAAMVEVLGGYGITRDYRLEKAMRDAPLLTIMDGTNDTLMMEVMHAV